MKQIAKERERKNEILTVWQSSSTIFLSAFTLSVLPSVECFDFFPVLIWFMLTDLTILTNVCRWNGEITVRPYSICGRSLNNRRKMKRNKNLFFIRRCFVCCAWREHQKKKTTRKTERKNLNNRNNDDSSNSGSSRSKNSNNNNDKENYKKKKKKQKQF